LPLLLRGGGGFTFFVGNGGKWTFVGRNTLSSPWFFSPLPPDAAEATDENADRYNDKVEELEEEQPVAGIVTLAVDLGWYLESSSNFSTPVFILRSTNALMLTALLPPSAGGDIPVSSLSL